MSKPWEKQIWKPLTLSAVDSRVSLFRVREHYELKPIHAGSGLSSPVWSLSYDPSTSSWKTYQGSYIGEWETSSLIWPKQGMMRHGTVYLHRPLGRSMKEKESCLWPTPRALTVHNKPERLSPEGRMSADGTQRFGLNLEDTVRMWPTQGSGGPNLAGAIDAVPGFLNPAWVEWLMGFPLHWTNLDSEAGSKPSETPSFHR